MSDKLLLWIEAVLSISITLHWLLSLLFTFFHFMETIKKKKPGGVGIHFFARPLDESCWHVMRRVKEEVCLEGLMTLIITTGSLPSLWPSAWNTLTLSSSSLVSAAGRNQPGRYFSPPSWWFHGKAFKGKGYWPLTKDVSCGLSTPFLYQRKHWLLSLSETEEGLRAGPLSEKDLDKFDVCGSLYLLLWGEGGARATSRYSFTGLRSGSEASGWRFCHLY